MDSTQKFYFYPDQWLDGTATMTAAQRGIYIQLLCYQWLVGPMTEEQAIQISGGDTISEIIRWVLKTKFEARADGRFQNPRLERERNSGNQPKPEASPGEPLDSPRIADREKPGPESSRAEKSRQNRSQPISGVSPQLEGQGYPDSLVELIRDWLAYKAERREGYKPTGLKQFLGIIRNRISEVGSDEVEARLRRAMASGWKGWDFPTDRQLAPPPTTGSRIHPRSFKQADLDSRERMLLKLKLEQAGVNPRDAERLSAMDEASRLRELKRLTELNYIESEIPW